LLEIHSVIRLFTSRNPPPINAATIAELIVAARTTNAV